MGNSEKAKVKKISDSTIRRLSKYFRSLEYLINRDIETVSSDQLAEMDSITSAQVRKDLSFFGTFGKRGLGYNTRVLKDQIGEILGLNRTWRVAIVGAGNIGRALASFAEFKKQGFQVCLVMDSDARKVGSTVADLEIQHTDDLTELVKAADVNIAIIAVPSNAAQKVADELIAAGVKALLNFAPISLKVPTHVEVKNENTAIDIEALSYYLTNQ